MLGLCFGAGYVCLLDIVDEESSFFFSRIDVIFARIQLASPFPSPLTAIGLVVFISGAKINKNIYCII